MQPSRTSRRLPTTAWRKPSPLTLLSRGASTSWRERSPTRLLPMRTAWTTGRSRTCSRSLRFSAPASNTRRPYRQSRHGLLWSASRAMPWCRLLARDHAAPESTLVLSKADQPCCGRVRPLAWCSRPRSSTALLARALAGVRLLGGREPHHEARHPGRKSDHDGAEEEHAD